MALSVLALLAAPALAVATTQISTSEVLGLDVIVVTDDGAGSEIQVGRGLVPEPFVAVESSSGATSVAPNCEEIAANLVTCTGDFDEVLVRGNGGADEVSMTLIADGQPPLLAEVFGGAGDDTLKTTADFRDIPQPQTLLSGELGDDTIEGGNGVDDLRGGEGNDKMNGFGGADFYLGEEGDDSIEALDGISDLVECGTGFDTAQADAVDAVDATCESVSDGTPMPVPIPTPIPVAAPLPTFGADPLVTLKLAARRIPASGPLRVRITNANGFAVSGELSGQKRKLPAPTKKPATASRRQPGGLKAKTFSVSANAEAVVELQLPRALRRSLKRTGKLSLELAAQVSDPAGNTRTVGQRVAPQLPPKPR